MRHTISYAALLLALSVGTAQAETPPGIDTSPYILENLAGAPQQINTHSWGDAPGGIPVTTTYASEAANNAQVLGAGNTGATAGDYLIDKNGNLVSQADFANANLGSSSTLTQISAAGFTQVSGTTNDPLNSYQWVPSTYANVASADHIAPLAANPVGAGVVVGGTYVAGDYVVDKTGAIVNPSTSCATATAGCTFVAPTAADATPTQNLPHQDVAANTGKQGVTSPTGDSTKTYNGGVTYGNNVSGASTAISANGLTYSDGKGGSVTIEDPSITVTNGTAAGTTKINNGNVTVGNSLKVGVGPANSTLTGAGLLVQDGAGNAGGVSATGVGVGNAKGAAGAVVQTSGTPALVVYGPAGSTAPQFIANSTGYISAEGNQIHDVKDPTLATDAANKGYVDTGISNLSNIMNNKFQHADGGIAAAMALQSPDRTGSQTWAVSLNEGIWNGQYATGLTAITQIANLGTWEVAGKGGFAVTSKGDIGGVVGFQIAGGGGYVPLK